jgi:hypothetical protein
MNQILAQPQTEIRRHAAARHDRPARAEIVLFVLLLIAHVALVWSFAFIPSQDGPAHLNNANALRKYADPAHPQFAAYYVRNAHLDPNYVTHALLGALMAFLPMITAQKVLASGYVLLLPLAARYALRSLRREASWASLLIFPFVCNFLFEKGFYNFCYSLGFFFLVLGFYLRHRADFRPRHVLGLFALTVPLYLAHPVSLALAYTSIGAIAATRAIAQRSEGTRTWRNLLLPAAALLPTAAMLASFVLRQRSESSHHFGPVKLAELLLSLQALYSFHKAELFVAAALAAVLGFTTLAVLLRKFRQRDWTPGDELLAAVAAFVPVYLLTPNVAAGGSWISTRLTLYPYLLLILWLGCQTLSRRARRLLQTTGVVAALALLVSHALAYHALGPYLQEYTSLAPHITPGSTLLPVCVTDAGFDPHGRPLSPRVKLFTQASGYLAASRDLIDLSNYEATKTYFPLAFRPELDPTRTLFDHPPEEDAPPATPMILDYARHTGGRGRIDYVLIWDVRSPEAAPEKQIAVSVTHELTGHYDLIYTSPNGFARLYRRKQ